MTWTESALIISPLSRLASSNASRVLPDPVGPEITTTFSFLFPRETEEVTEENKRRRGSGGGDGRRKRKQRVRRPQSSLIIIFNFSIDIEEIIDS